MARSQTDKWKYTVLVFLAGILWLTSVPVASARPVSVYTVAKVKLDVSAESAVLAKKQALRTGPLIALKQIFRRLAPFRAYDRLADVTLNEADDLIDGFAVRSERNSSTRYLALLDYNFSRKKLQALFVKKGVPFFDRRSGKQILMPVFGALQENNSVSEANNSAKKWWKAWRTIDLKHGLTDTRLYKAKTGDHQNWRRIVAGEFNDFRDMRKRYAATKLILVDAQLNEEKDKLTLRIFGEDYRGSVDYSQEIPVETGVEKTYEVAAAIAYGILEGRWREPQIIGDVIAVSTNPGNGDATGDQAEATGRRLVDETIFLRVKFSGLRDWQQIRKRLGRIPGVQKMQVNSLSPRGADVRMIYPGGANRLQTQLSSYGFAMDQNGNDLVLRSTSR